MEGALKKILIVDDDYNVLAFVGTLFRISGYHTTVATDGLTAIQEFHSERPDAVILDHDMPFMTGLETLKEFKKIAPDVPVVMFSGSMDDTLWQKAFLAGAHDFILKPASHERIISAVRSAIEGGAGVNGGMFGA